MVLVLSMNINILQDIVSREKILTLTYIRPFLEITLK